MSLTGFDMIVNLVGLRTEPSVGLGIPAFDGDERLGAIVMNDRSLAPESDHHLSTNDLNESSNIGAGSQKESRDRSASLTGVNKSWAES